LQGFVISDWLGIDRITSPPAANYTYSVQAGINAGIDMVCSFENTHSYFLLAMENMVAYFLLKKYFGHDLSLYMV
jgi:beta-glucosidase-like glycosyl hydrolase